MTTSDNDTTNLPLKRCSKGDNCVHPMGCMQPATIEHFNKKRGGVLGLMAICRACRSVARREQWQQSPKHKDTEYAQKRRSIANDRQELAAQGKKRCSICLSIKPMDRAHFHYTKRFKDGFDVYCIECRKEKSRTYTKRYYATNPNANKTVAARRAKAAYKKRNPERVRESAKRYGVEYRKRPETRDRVREYNRTYSPGYRGRNRLRIQIHSHNYRARAKALPSTLTPEQWQRALDYFNGCCAVCGRQLNDLFGTHYEAMDHWLSLADPDCPGTTALNCIPLCHGENGCNNKKQATRPADWLKRDFPKQAKAILARVETYFAWVREQDGEAPVDSTDTKHLRDE